MGRFNRLIRKKKINIQHANKPRKLCIAIDLLPLLPAGANGGAKQLVVALIQGLGRIAKQDKFILLCSAMNYKELAYLDAKNISRFLIKKNKINLVNFDSLFGKLISCNLVCRLISLAKLAMCHRLINYIIQLVKKIKQLKFYFFLDKALLKKLKVDILFCPFTAPFFYTSGIPIVSILYDLQYIYYPSFFSDQDRFTRARNFRMVCQLANKIICISEFVRLTVVKNSNLSPNKLQTIYINLPDKTPKINVNKTAELLVNLNLSKNNFIIYPANFWLHKNHRVLFIAFRLYKLYCPYSDLKLVCTGTPCLEMEKLAKEVALMGLAKSVLFLGYVARSDLDTLFAASRALIFPSLYEGFGIPLIEAMRLGKPVLCSNTTSLPEIAKAAAYYFNPKKPYEIAEAIVKLATKPRVFQDYICKGYERGKEFNNFKEMVKAYYVAIKEVAYNGQKQCVMRLYGVYEDAWVGKSMEITIPPAKLARRLKLEFNSPIWHPIKKIKFSLLSYTNKKKETCYLEAGKKLVIEKTILKKGEEIKIEFKNYFQPNRFDIARDFRELSCICKTCDLLSEKNQINLLLLKN
jgi:glycosyltransferase involved in cell wall biosynthesis